MKSVFCCVMLILPLPALFSRSLDLPLLAPADSLLIVQDNLLYMAGADEAFRPDPAHLFVFDFNKAHNPYCAYNGMYSCAIPEKADVLPLALKARGKNYHE